VPARRKRDGARLAVLLMAPFLAQADATIVNVAIPSIGGDLGASGAALELVVGGHLIVYAVLLITGARLGQTHGYRRLFLFGLAGFGGASLLCGLAPDPAVLVFARVLQGAGAALMYLTPPWPRGRRPASARRPAGRRGPPLRARPECPALRPRPFVAWPVR
jgi:MFS family permease